MVLRPPDKALNVTCECGKSVPVPDIIVKGYEQTIALQQKVIEDLKKQKKSLEADKQFLQTALGETRLKYTKKKGKRNKKPVLSRKQKVINEKTLIISTLLAHHQFDKIGKDSQELKFESIEQIKIAKQLKWNQSKVSRVIKRSFPTGFWKKYKLSCKSDILKGFLKKLDDAQVEIDAIS